jgi:ribosomal protein S28E/S33
VKKSVCFALILSIVAAGCSSLSMDTVKNLPISDHKLYNVIFEDKPTITAKEVYAGTTEIGKVLDETAASGNLTVVKISVQNEHEHFMRSNVVFYVSEGRLELDTVGDIGEALSEGAKILGFTGKTGLYWFKTKSKVKSLSDSAKSKAEELYNRAFK